MAKKKKSGNAGLILSVVVLLLGVAAFCMAFLVGVKYVTSKGTALGEFTGIQVMFGYSKEVLVAEVKVLEFSILATLAFALPLVGAIVGLVNNKIAKLVAALVMIAGAVLMFLLPSFVVFAADGAADLVSGVATLGIGAIIGGICAGLGGLVAGYAALRK